MSAIISRKSAWMLLLGTLVLPAHYTNAQAPQDERGAEDKPKFPAVMRYEPLKAEVGDDELRRLLKERFNAALSELQARYMEYTAGKASIEHLMEASRRLLDSQLELIDKPSDRVAAHEKHVEITKLVEENAKTRWDAGKIAEYELHYTRYVRIDAEIQLLKAKRQAKAVKPK
jgi:hypothetical protein